ncbi:hypothetical protein M2360_003881 [Rhizobium sp. SG_E_25_P2]|uniref:hypothetical protein n=1 Tax=Rhizobium sp. SG_E_25_P2 TaxID=2879942 RepID=UPI0024757486|nr:hypothetical protein [Rhizobium sp. SG_E_25_P2]MDH6268475.1 hypothetical protein [Rhizobium sp. SG_E_25_P2]
MSDIYKTIKPYILANLPYKIGDPATARCLQTKSTEELLIMFLNWFFRQIPPRPRTVFPSKEVTNKINQDENRHEILSLISDIKTGKSLKSRLSKAVNQGFVLTKNQRHKPLSTSKRPDFDLLLNDWGIHHLHLSNTVENDGFTTRTKGVMFAIFTYEEAYLIDTFDHKSWSSKQAVRKVISNWPDSNFFLEVKGLGVRHDDSDCFDEQELQGLRTAGMSCPIVIDQKIYIPRQMLSHYGTNTNHTRIATLILRKTNLIEETLKNTPAVLDSHFKANGTIRPERPEFRFEVFANSFGIYETSTDTAIGLVPFQ